MLSEAGFSDVHGVSGYTTGTQTSLSNEKVKFKRGGILPALCQHLGEPSTEEVYSLKDILYNLPFIHRAFDLTYSSDIELFIPIISPKIVRSGSTHEAWFCAELKDKYATQRTINKLSNNYERDLSVEEKFIVRTTRRFDWRPSNRSASLNRYKEYHKRLRTDLLYINGGSRLWYIKRSGNIDGIISRNTMALIFSAMHKLSEMARYAPDVLSRHFDCQQNWLLSEFISLAPTQFIDEISSELTGHEFMQPGKN
jgi:hypothetical protein